MTYNWFSLFRASVITRWLYSSSLTCPGKGRVIFVSAFPVSPEICSDLPTTESITVVRGIWGTAWLQPASHVPPSKAKCELKLRRGILGLLPEEGQMDPVEANVHNSVPLYLFHTAMYTVVTCMCALSSHSLIQHIFLSNYFMPGIALLGILWWTRLSAYPHGICIIVDKTNNCQL